MSDLLHSRYQMRRELGQGGMSVVYLALDERLKREVAVKVLHPHLATRADSRRRFLQEATAIARLEHPHILKIYDYASPDEERSYIVSQRIKGVTLKEWMDELPPLPCEVVSLLALPIFEALAHAHGHSIIHRDVKPENVMIQEEDGAPILMDFGIAHLVDAETLTATGAVIGSPAHMAPEVVNGETLTARADIFSMGTVLYWMCCGALPFVAPNPAALFRRILEARFDPLLERRPDTFAPLARLVERCMRREPDQRPRGAAEIAAALRAMLDEVGIGDHLHELRSLSEDRALYIEELPQRLAPRYLERARALKLEGDGAGALDRINRALALDPNLEEATLLKEELLNAVRPSRLSRGLLLVAGLALGGIWQALPRSELGAVEARGTAALELQGGRALGDASRGAAEIEPQLKEGPPALERPPSAGAPLSDQAVIGSAAPLEKGAAQGGSSGSSAEPSQDKRSPLRLTKLSSRRAKRAPVRPKRLGEAVFKGRDRRVMSPSLRRGAGVVAPAKLGVNKSEGEGRSERRSPTPQGYQIVAIRSRYKGVSVWLDGKRVGRIFEVERSEGLKLKVGVSHLVSFRSPYCEEQKEPLRFEQVQSSPAKLVFECRFKPSSFKVVGPQGAEIYLRGEVPLRLGLTNQEISYKMSQATQKLSLLVVARGQGDQPLSLKLTAGRHTEVKLP